MKKKKLKKSISNFWQFVRKYNVVIICFFTSLSVSAGVIYYSSAHVADIFPSPVVAFIFIVNAELLLTTLRYINAAVNPEIEKDIIFDFSSIKLFLLSGFKKLFSYFTLLNLAVLIAFILTVVPATLGTGKNNQNKYVENPGEIPELSKLVSTWERANEKLTEQYEKNSDNIVNSDDTSEIEKLKKSNEKIIKDINSNADKVKIEKDKYDKALKLYQPKKESYNAAKNNAFYNFLNDYFIKFFVVAIQFLSVFATGLGVKRYRQIKNEYQIEANDPVGSTTGKAEINLDPEAINKILYPLETMAANMAAKLEGMTLKLENHEKAIRYIEKHSGQVIQDMIELNGELEQMDHAKIEGQIVETSKPGFFETTMQKGKTK